MYNRVFWLAYAANTMLMVCVSILFRYANFVQLRVGEEFEFTLGLIVGVGMVGALAMRGVLGLAIDRYGAGRVWMISLAIVMTSLLLHWAITPFSGPMFSGLVYLARILQMVGLAGAFGASLTFISLRAPQGRIGETVGMLGTSGFIGMATGPFIGDWLFADGAITVHLVQQMFLMALVAAGISLALTILANVGTKRIHVDHRRRPPVLWLLKRYHPGAVLFCAAAMGIGFMLPSIFLQPYAESLGIKHIRSFFLVYALVAFGVRVLTRHFTDRHGVRLTTQLGLGFMAVSMLSFILVKSEWLLTVPALLGGIAHAFLFPAVVTGGSISFPARYRGLATTLVLAMFDMSNLIGQPLIGAIVEYAPSIGLPGYTTMFAAVAGVMVTAALAASGIRESRGNSVPELPLGDEEETDDRQPEPLCSVDTKPCEVESASGR